MITEVLCAAKGPKFPIMGVNPEIMMISKDAQLCGNELLTEALTALKNNKGSLTIREAIQLFWKTLDENKHKSEWIHSINIDQIGIVIQLASIDAMITNQADKHYLLLLQVTFHVFVEFDGNYDLMQHALNHTNYFNILYSEYLKNNMDIHGGIRVGMITIKYALLFVILIIPKSSSFFLRNILSKFLNLFKKN